MKSQMKAAVLYGKRDLRVEKRERPTLGPRMVLVRINRVGICGSDLHYYDYGRCGGFIPTRPFVLGHELTGVIVESDGTQTLPVGARVTVNPARACGECEYCQAGRRNLCPDTVMLGSASTNPPTDGAASEFVAVRDSQCFVLPDEMSDGEGAMIEPLAVALHAVKRAGPIGGKRVLVTGGGPIGLLAAMTARAMGAAPVALSDIVEGRRKAALEFGADVALDPTDPDITARLRDLVGYGFDVVFEASGSERALQQCFQMVRRGGTIVQVGTLSGELTSLPANQIMAKEIRLVGSFRYNNVFEEAIRLVASKRIDVSPLVTTVLPFDQIDQAMKQALAKDGTIKVQVSTA